MPSKLSPGRLVHLLRPRHGAALLRLRLLLRPRRNRRSARVVFLLLDPF
jgi:hypothetical protein